MGFPLILGMAAFLPALAGTCQPPPELAKLIAARPSADAYVDLGAWFAQRRQVKCAADAFRSALRLNPSSWEARYNLGLALLEQHDLAGAAAQLTRAADLSPKDTRTRVALGMALMQQEKLEAAEGQLRKAVELSPADLPSLSALGMVLTRMHRPEAVAVLRKALELAPNSAEAHLNVGIALADQQDHAHAQPEFAQAVALAPESAAAHYNLGRCLYDLRRYEDAKPELETAYRLNPDFTPALLSLAMNRRKLGELPQAAEVLTRLLTLEPANAEAHQHLGQLEIELGKLESGIGHLKKAVQLEPRNSQYLYALLRSLSAKASPDVQQVREQLRALKEEEIQLNRIRALGNFANAASNEGNWPTAISQSREAIQLCGDCALSADLHKNLGLILARSGDEDGGVRELETALARKPDDPDTRTALAVLRQWRAQRAGHGGKKSP